MTIERTDEGGHLKPLKVHKNLVILALRNHPEDMPNIAPDFDGTVEEFIAALEADPCEWIVNGSLCE